MMQNNEIDDPRRELLVRLLASGVFAITSPLFLFKSVRSETLPGLPGPLPPGRSIYELNGDVQINDRPATLDTFISATDHIKTGDNSNLIFVAGKDAFILRSNSNLQLSADDGSEVADQIKGTTVNVLRLVTGKLLSVFGKRRHTINTITATIGIRGTGVYVEAAPDETYVCTCYGMTDLSTTSDPESKETIISTHHDAPRYILAEGDPGNRIRSAPFKNHSDEELLLIETLVGRSTAFPVTGDNRNRKRRY